jgi:nucleotide-binding universal stress UspA family protein
MSDRINRQEVLTSQIPNGQGLVNCFKKILVGADLILIGRRGRSGLSCYAFKM